MSAGRWARFQTRVRGATGQPRPVEAPPVLRIPVEPWQVGQGRAAVVAAVQELDLAPRWSGWKRRALPTGWQALLDHGRLRIPPFTWLVMGLVLTVGAAQRTIEGLVVGVLCAGVAAGLVVALARLRREAAAPLDAAPLDGEPWDAPGGWSAALRTLATHPFVARDGSRLVDGRGPAERSLQTWEGWLRERELLLDSQEEELRAGVALVGELAGLRAEAGASRWRLLDALERTVAVREQVLALRKEVAWTRRELAGQDELVTRGDDGGVAEADLTELYGELAQVARAWASLQADGPHG
ncbi:MAG: hypothetical protein H6742_19300 [Alphaproteobacteria bacterium]|nr:hypothetical protein [Alphaproteobacteria bacterium]